MGSKVPRTPDGYTGLHYITEAGKNFLVEKRLEHCGNPKSHNNSSDMSFCSNTCTAGCQQNKVQDQGPYIQYAVHNPEFPLKFRVGKPDLPAKYVHKFQQSPLLPRHFLTYVTSFQDHSHLNILIIYRRPCTAMKFFSLTHVFTVSNWF